jgi:N-acetylmuramoyl-L-alanine amidase
MSSRRVVLVLGLVVAVFVPAHDAPAYLSQERAPTSTARYQRPKISKHPIPYGKKRRRQMARYSKRHYGRARWRLESPKVVVLHFTAGDSYASAWNHFASNAPNRGELPGVCAQYMIKKGGAIKQLVPPTVRCRHAIGLNYTAIGIEMVQETGRGSHWADRQILERKPQITSALKLVRYLRARFGIRMSNVIGHAMANNSRYFKDLQGWTSDHTDWLWRDVKVFRRRLRKIS